MTARFCPSPHASLIKRPALTCHFLPASVRALSFSSRPSRSLLGFELTPLVRASTSTQERGRPGTPSSGPSNHRKRTGGRMEPRGATWG